MRLSITCLTISIVFLAFPSALQGQKSRPLPPRNIGGKPRTTAQTPVKTTKEATKAIQAAKAKLIDNLRLLPDGQGTSGAHSSPFYNWHLPRSISVEYTCLAPAPTYVQWQLFMAEPPQVARLGQELTGIVATGDLRSVATGKPTRVTIDLSPYTPSAPALDQWQPQARRNVAISTGVRTSTSASRISTGATSNGGTGRVNLRTNYNLPAAPVSFVPIAVGERLIQRTGSATYYLRFVSFGPRNAGLSRSLPVAFRIGEPPIPDVRTLTQIEIPATVGDNVHAQGDWSNSVAVGSNANLSSTQARWVTDSAAPAKVYCGVSALPTAHNPQALLDPSCYLALFPVTRPPGSTSGQFQLDLSKPLAAVGAKTPLYVRTLAADSSGALMASPQDAIVMPSPTTLNIQSQKAPPEKVVGNLSVVLSYVPERVTSVDDSRHFILTSVPPKGSLDWTFLTSVAGNTPLHVGQKFYFPPQAKDQSFFDYIGDVFTFIENFVDGLSELYNTLKHGLVMGVADATGLDPAIVEAALDVAMAAAGLPPSLPNMDQLMNEGADYLASEAAEAAIGNVPPQVEHALAQKLKDGIVQAASDMTSKSGSASSNLYLKPDPEYMSHPCELNVVTMLQPVAGSTASGPVVVGGIHISSAAKWHVPNTLYSGSPNEESAWIFDQYVPIPKMKLGQSYIFPVCLAPLVASPVKWQQAFDYASGADWKLDDQHKTLPLNKPWAINYSRKVYAQ